MQSASFARAPRSSMVNLFRSRRLLHEQLSTGKSQDGGLHPPYACYDVTNQSHETSERKAVRPLLAKTIWRLQYVKRTYLMDLVAASLKEKLWHKLRQDLQSYVPQITENDLLMCCTCGRFLPYQDFNLEHIIPLQALADDPAEIKANPETTANARSGNILLCCKPLRMKGRKVYNNGCNSWKGRFYDGRTRELLNGRIFDSQHRKISN